MGVSDEYVVDETGKIIKVFQCQPDTNAQEI
jgi:hypothetical protein